jgi:hypothetical protein
LNWQWDVLPPPTQYGWTNVVYSMHAYPGGSDTPTNEINKQVNDFNNHQSWNVPDLVGEFNWEANTPADWQYGIQQFDQNNLNWSLWAYKAIAGGVPNSWGIYDPASAWPSTPNIQTDSASSISNSWSQWTTIPVFGLTPFMKQYLGAPIAVDDFYTNTVGTLTVNSQTGVLANDQDTNLNVSGISLSAALVSNPVNGQLNFNTNGAFTYTPNPGFHGIDTFQYRAFDGYVNSANIATVSISNSVAGSVAQLIWVTQPAGATNGLPFAQQPLLETADALGNPTTNGLPAGLMVTIAHSAGAGMLLGATNCDLGMAAGAGAVSFTNLQINAAGAGNELTASLLLSPAVSWLTNGNFNSPASIATPTAWTTWTFGGGYANHEVITPAASVLGDYDGTYQMTCGAGNTSGGGGIYQIVPAGAGLVYSLSVESGAQNWWWPYGEARLFFLDANSNPLATNVIIVTTGINNDDVGKPYQPYQLSAVAPAGAGLAKVEFAGYGGGSVWFDNAVLMASNNVPAIAAATTSPFAVYPAVAGTNYVAGIINVGQGVFTLAFVGTAGVQYYVQTATNLAGPANWQIVPGSTNPVVNAGGTWTYTVTNADQQRYYRSAAVVP